METEKQNYSKNSADKGESITQSYSSQPVIKKMLPKKKSWKKIIIIIIALMIAVFLLGYALIGISFYGGLDGAINNLKPAPNADGPRISTLRDEATKSINEDFLVLESKVDFDEFATATHDVCYDGQNDYKRNDGFAHACAYRKTKFYGFNGDFRQRMIELEQEILSSGWSKPYDRYDSEYPMKTIMEQYYDVRIGSEKPKVDYSEQNLVSGLGSPGKYTKWRKSLEINYAEKETKDFFSIERAQKILSVPTWYEKKDFQDIDAVFQKITQVNRYVLVISIQETYFMD